MNHQETHSDLHTDLARELFKVDEPTGSQRKFAKQINYMRWYSCDTKTLEEFLSEKVSPV